MCSLERSALPERLSGPEVTVPEEPEVTVPEEPEVTVPEGEEEGPTGAQRVLVKLMDLKVRKLPGDPADVCCPR